MRYSKANLDHSCSSRRSWKSECRCRLSRWLSSMAWAGPDPRGIGANAGPRHLSCCSWLLLLSLSALLLLRGSLLLPGSSLLPRADTPVQQADARGVNASLIRGVNPLNENRTTSAALGSNRAAGMPPHALEFARSG
jgi:hypothetical protein